MTKTITVLFLIILTGLFNLNAQEGEHKPSETPSLEPYMFLVGEWKGEGWIMQGRERKEFTQTETIVPKVESSILVIDGIGYAKGEDSEEKRIIHNAFGVISYNRELETFTMLSYSAINGKMETPLELIEENKMQWSFQDERGGTIRFSEDYSDGVWKETGHYSPDGEKWFPFFEMTLKRVDK